ncbi:peptidase [Psychromonas sp. RZ5]|nr:peptidase [Psychromonas sp. RZ5]
MQKLANQEQKLKWFALVLGIFSTIATIQDWYPYTMFISLPFCLIWIYCAWLHTERQLKYINIIFSVLYIYGIARYFLLH